MTDPSLVTLLFMAVFFTIMMWIGLKSRKHASDINGFVLGSRQVGPWLSAFAYGTSYFSAVIFVGYAGQFGWNFGLASTWIGLGNAFIGSLLAWLVLGRRTRIMTQHLMSKTMPDFFGIRYESDKLRTAASLITFVFLIPYTASLYNGLSRLFAIAFPGVDYAVCVVIMAALTGVYVILGGYMATAWNDFIQGIIMLFGIVAVIAAVLGDNGGLNLAMEKLATGPTGGWQYASFLGANPLFLLFVVILTSLGTWGLPQMVGKFYAIKNESSIQKGTVISTLFAIVVAGGCYFLGGFGRLYDIDVKAQGFDAVIPRMLSSLPAVIIGIVIVLVLSASMSTLSSLVLTSASTMTLDLIAPKRKKPLREKDQLLLMRGFILLFVVISALIAIKQAKSKSLFIAQMMGVSWGALAGAFLAPFLYGLYSKRTTKVSTAVCFAWGVGLETVQLLISLGVVNVSGSPLLAFVFNNSIYSGVIAMVGGLLLVPLVDIFSQRFRPVRVEEMFAAYHEHRTVDITDNLGK
ncbi:MAG: sodium:solute symporter [Clostridia bacterium]|nr:sodium:solute symporter [Clostridia bacterium]